jgi:hypothetical protein
MYINFMLTILIIGLNIGACLLDVDYHLIRGGVSRSGGTALLGVSSWVQYQSRICTMLSIVILTYIFESNSKGVNILELIGASYFLSWLFGFLYLKSEKFHRHLSLLVLLPTRLVFSEFKDSSIWYKKKYALDKSYLFGFSLYFMFGLAVVVPFVFASLFPELRMTFALTGQLLNFLGSMLVFTAVEPRYFKSVDSKKDLYVSLNLANSRLHAAFLLSILLLII